MKRKEVEDIRKALVKEKDPKVKAKLALYLQREDSRRKMNAKKAKAQQLRKQRRQLEAELVAEGKRPFYLKKSEEKKLQLVSQYQEMRGKKNFSEFLEKRMQRTASKQHRKLPARNIKD
jgi:ribosomal RNA-processing protein 36